MLFCHYLRPYDFRSHLPLDLPIRPSSVVKIWRRRIETPAVNSQSDFIRWQRVQYVSNNRPQWSATGGITHSVTPSIVWSFLHYIRSNIAAHADRSICCDETFKQCILMTSLLLYMPWGGASGAALCTPWCAIARNIMSHFSHPKGIYSVSRCDCSSVGAPGSHLSVPRCQQERRRLHQTSGKWDSLPEERERERGRATRKPDPCWVWWRGQMGEREEIWQSRGDRADRNMNAWRKWRAVWERIAVLIPVINQVFSYSPTSLPTCHPPSIPRVLSFLFSVLVSLLLFDIINCVCLPPSPPQRCMCSVAVEPVVALGYI